MRKISQRLRLLGALHPQDLFDARLDDIREEKTATGKQIVLALQMLRAIGPAEECVEDGRVCVRVRARGVPARLRFTRAEWLARTGVFERLAEQPLDSGARRLFGVAHYRSLTHGTFYWLRTGTAEPGDMIIRAGGHVLEKDEAPGELVEVVRRWADPPPPMPGLVPLRPVLHHCYAGNPIAIRLGRRVLRNRLFIGGIGNQRERRPAVDHVLNLCGVANPWIAQMGVHASDRYACKGEGPLGMDAGELIDEAAWVVERLRAGRRVLVHCYAGMNRSATVCCAALMMLEGVSAEEALARVRERHPFAWPDPYHWFVLEWLSRSGAPIASQDEAPDAREESTPADVLSEVAQPVRVG